MSKSLRWLFCFFFAALLPAMILRDFTPSNELRYLSIADEAIRDGHLFAFTSHGAPYADKPPLYLWIVMAGKLLFGSHCMGFLALFSFFPALVILRTMDRWVRSVLDERARIAEVTMTMTSGLFLGLAVFLRMDMLMCMFIVLSLHAFWRLYSGEGSSRRAAILFPLYAFLALFTKGPVGLLVPLLSTVVFLVVQRQWRQIGRYWGWRTWGILLAGCAVWFTAVWAEGGTEYLDNLLFHQTLDRAVDAFHHKAPFYFYGVSVWYSLAPWSLFLAVVFAAAWRQHVRLGELERFFLSVVLTTFVMLSLFSSKLAVYLAPAFPFVVYAGGLLFARVRMNGWMRAALAVPAVIWTLALPAVAVAASMPATAFVANGWCFAAGALLSAGCGSFSSAGTFIAQCRLWPADCCARFSSADSPCRTSTACWVTASCAAWPWKLPQSSPISPVIMSGKCAGPRIWTSTWESPLPKFRSTKPWPGRQRAECFSCPSASCGTTRPCSTSSPGLLSPVR